MKINGELDRAIRLLNRGSYDEARRVLNDISGTHDNARYWLIRSLVAAARGRKVMAQDHLTRATNTRGYLPVDHGDLLLQVSLVNLRCGKKGGNRETEDTIKTLRCLYQGHPQRLPAVKILEGLGATLDGDYDTAIQKHCAARAEWDQVSGYCDPDWIQESMWHNDFYEIFARAMAGQLRSEEGQALVQDLMSSPLSRKQQYTVRCITTLKRKGCYLIRFRERTTFLFWRTVDHMPF